MSTIEHGPRRPGLDLPPREPPPLVFSAAVEKAAKPVAPRAAGDRKPLSRAAARRRTSWARRMLALIVFAIVIAGAVAAIKDSKITVQSKRHKTVHTSTLLSAQQLGLVAHRSSHHGR
jgi:uncharacterized membrane protein YidH (DUF202 family)